MNIPKKEGKYTLNIGEKTLNIDIHIQAERMNRLDMIGAGMRSRIGGFKYVPQFNVSVLDGDGNVIDSISTFDEGKYVAFITSYVVNENDITVDPEKIKQELYMKIQKSFGSMVMKNMFNGVVKDKLKFTYYVDDWDINNGCYYEPQKLVDFFTKMGIECKVAPKKRGVRASTCWVASVYVPLDFDVNTLMESRRPIRLTESELRKMISESVKEVLENNFGANPLYYKNKEQSLRNYWASKGLSGKELERKVYDILKRQRGSSTSMEWK